MNNPVISVIMAVYNEPMDWVKEAIDSILNQTFGDFEFLIIDDNPLRPENSQLIESYAKQDKRIRPIANPENLGLTKSLNKCLEMAKGKYIARMDADDIALPERFSMQMDFLQRNPAYVLCGSWVEYFGIKTKVRKFKITDEEIKIDMLYDCPVAHPSFFIDSEVLKKNKIRYDEKFRTSQDYAMCFELSKFGKIYNIPKVLLKYRMSGNRVTLKKKNEQLRNASLIRKKVLSHWMSELQVSFDPDERALRSGKSLAEFGLLKQQLLKRKDYSQIYLNKLVATITLVLYASVDNDRVRHFLSLISKDVKALLYEPKKFIKALLYLSKVLPAKETLVR